MLFDISAMLDEHVAYQLLRVSGAITEARDPVDRIVGQMEPIRTRYAPSYRTEWSSCLPLYIREREIVMAFVPSYR